MPIDAEFDADRRGQDASDEYDAAIGGAENEGECKERERIKAILGEALERYLKDEKKSSAFLAFTARIRARCVVHLLGLIEPPVTTIF